MHPVLLQIGSLKVYSYGVFVAIGFLAALWVSGREIARQGPRPREVPRHGVLGGPLRHRGARLFHVLVYWRQYAEAPGEILKLWNGGLVFYGGFIAATVACVVFLRRNRMPFLPVADASSLGIVLGLAFGRLGCTSAGCCFGKPTTLPWAITFTDPACLAPLNVPLHPTQIYEAIGGFAIFGFLYLTRDRFKTPGMRFWTMLILYGAARSFFEIFRDDPRGFVGPFSESQVVSAVLITYAIVSDPPRPLENRPLRQIARYTRSTKCFRARGGLPLRYVRDLRPLTAIPFDAISASLHTPLRGTPRCALRTRLIASSGLTAVVRGDLLLRFPGASDARDAGVP